MALKFLAPLAVGLAFTLGSTAHGQSVATVAGSLQGVTQGDVTSFKGIPFAAPPVGENRWRAPQPMAPWDGVRSAAAFGPDCAQVASAFGASGNPAGTSEDCLYLNIWRPAGVSAGQKLPVMVWIYGGAFVVGSGAQPSCNGEAFARQGVVLVTLNYRLGRFGFFAFPALNAEHPDEAKGNFAYLDQIAALQWVQKNIATFGGDPANVTIFGESAGGVSVHSLLTSPLARGLFHKAIIESGGGRDGTLSPRPLRADKADANYPVSAETIGRNFATRYGIAGDGPEALAKLRALSTEQVIDGGQETAGPDGPRTYSGPMLDGRVIVTTAQSAYRAGQHAKVPLMIGSNSAEVPAGFVPGATKQELFDSFGKGRAAAIAAYDPQGTIDFALLSAQVNTDRVWAEPAHMTAEAFTRQGTPAFVYRFSYVADSMKDRVKLGAPHASEIDFVFDTVRARYGAALTARDQSTALIMNTYWANFAKTGHPDGRGLPHWPRFSLKNHEILDITADGTPQAGPDRTRARLDANARAEGAVIPR